MPPNQFRPPRPIAAGPRSVSTPAPPSRRNPLCALGPAPGDAHPLGDERSEGLQGRAKSILLAGFSKQAPTMSTRTSPTQFPQAEIGREMKGSDAVVECLIREGVEVVF